MNGITEPLPGLLDDPQFQITDLPALTDFHIAPLRNPAPVRHANVPLPLEPVAGNIINPSRGSKTAAHPEDIVEKRRAPAITPSDVLLAREAKKPHLAINELVEGSDGSDIIPTQLPSFISLAVVEKSPIQAPTPLEQVHAQKRLRLDGDSDHIAAAHNPIRHLPRPAQKDERQSRRPAPLLPAMVTGLHEPPPSAALLPSIDLDSRPGILRTTTSKIHVKDILTQSDHGVATTASTPGSLATSAEQESLATKQLVDILAGPSPDAPFATAEPIPASTAERENKARRARRMWTESETQDLLAGVTKYGVGKWKQILDDPAFNFSGRSSVDLKDRYRVCSKDEFNLKGDSQDGESRLPARLKPDDTHTAADDATSPAAEPPLPVQTDSTTGSPLVNQPAAPKQRRKRRAWTAVEDDALLRGVARHGFQWTTIHDDPDLDLTHRRATDLRDRIRNKFPDGYKHAETAPLKSELRKAERLSAAATASAAAGRHALTNGMSGSAHKPTPSTPAVPLRPPDVDREREKEQAGVTLPSFTLDDDDMNWEDNRLPPLHEWDEIGL